MKRFTAGSAWFVLFLIGGCGPAVNLDAPPDLRLGEDTCEHCRMIISEIRFAACGYGPAGEPYRFDDIGCLVRFLSDGSRDVGSLWVHDYSGDDWLPAATAHIVVSEDIHTAMGSGTVAVGTAEEATRLADESAGEVTTFSAWLAGDAAP